MFLHQPSQRSSSRLLAPLLACALLVACSGGGAEEADGSGSDAADTTGSSEPGRVGEPCRQDRDCLSGQCLESEYGPPFCSRACDDPGEHCVPGSDAAEGEALCVSFEVLPNPATPSFIGEEKVFCIPRCRDLDECQASNANWEACDVPKYFGDPVSTNLGTSFRVCASPSYQGKDPVDPATCNWAKLVTGSTASEAQICNRYCEYLVRCKEVPTDYDEQCCGWGCFNQMYIEGELNDPWKDEAKCYVDVHYAYPDVGRLNSCNRPPVECGGTPDDPTPPAAVEE